MFIHLRNHTTYTLCEGAIKLPSLLHKVQEEHMPAVAISDNGNLFGALEFSLKFSKEGIQPIIACDILLKLTDAPFSSTNIQIGHDLRQMVLLAANEQGYLNLMALVSHSYLQRQTGIPVHINLSELRTRTDGLIALTGGVKGIIAEELLGEQQAVAETILQDFQQLFPGRLYMELQRHGLEVEELLEPKFLDLAYQYNIPLVATNDVYFLTPDMYEAQDILKCIGKGWYISQQERERLTPEHYFKSMAEMEVLFADLPEAIENTVKIAKRCAYMAFSRPPTLPHFDLPPGVSEAEELTRLTREGLAKRLETKFRLEKTPPEQQPEIRKLYEERMEMELKIIIQMDFPGYFLIVADFINWSKDHDIPIGPGRGSGAGSIVAWAMRITDVDSIRFTLFFERFLNPERVSMPDFDIDLCQARRKEVIRYVQQKYGENMVASIITFGTLKAKAVLKDVGRVLQMSYNQVDKICKMIPFSTAEVITLEKAIEMDTNLQEARDSDPEVSHLIKIALQLEGLNRHSSTHAAGVVIGFRPLEEICALYKDESAGIGGINSDDDSEELEDFPAVGYTMKYVETVGLVKFDFLGLKTLTIIKAAVDLVRQTQQIPIVISDIDLNDQNVYRLLSNAETIGVFQLESSGMCTVMKQMQPNRIEDIIALISLYRPGPMDSIPTYIRCKNGEEPIKYLHPLMEPILKETYGVIVYQEQVMEIAKALAGYSLGGADLLRRAMGKKIKEEMDKQRSVFVEGCTKNQISPGLAGEIFDLLAKFASYGFNKSHAAAYAIIGYQTAWLKYYYPVEFMVANLNLELHDSDKLNVFRQSIVDNGISILPPDINQSAALFSIEELSGPIMETAEIASLIANAKVKKYNVNNGHELAIRFGLGAIKAVGVAAMQKLIEERIAHGPFTDIFDLCARLDSKVINKKSLEALAKAGALDSIHPNRKQIFDSAESLVRYVSNLQKDREDSQISLFAESGLQNEFIKPVLAATDDWQGRERLQKEFEAFGYYLTSHPLDIIRTELDTHGIVYYHELEQDYVTESCVLKMAGVVAEVRHRSSAKGRFAYVYLSDPSGLYETSIFSDELINTNRNLLEAGQELVIECLIRKDDTATRILIRNLWSMAEFLRQPANHLTGAARVKRQKPRNPDAKPYNRAADPKAPDNQAVQAKVAAVFQHDLTKIRTGVTAFQTALIRVKGLSGAEAVKVLLEHSTSLQQLTELQPTAITLIVDCAGTHTKLKLPDQYYITENYLNELKKIVQVIHIEVS